MKLYDLANDGRTECFVFCNAAALDIEDDGMALLAPFGDSHYQVDDGTGKTRTIIQRVTRENAPKIIEGFNGLFGKVKRWFKAATIYNGHPDHPDTSHLYPDKEPKGVFKDLEIRDKGIYFRPIFNERGVELINSSKKLFPSVRWNAAETGEKDGKKVLEPFNIVSVGLTPTPNLPTELMNDFGRGAKLDTIMEKRLLIAALIAAGVKDLTNESTDIQITAVIADLGSRAATVPTLTNERTQATSQVTTLSNERKTLIEHLVNEKQKAGGITEAENKVWVRRLTSDFANEWPDFSKLEGKKVKTESAAGVDGSRKTPIPEAASAGEKILALTNERMAKHPQYNTNRSLAYTESYRAVLSENPALAEQIKAQA